ncbi:class I SAM-dependent methyltransferase [Paenibacillus tarimensis]
MDYNKLRDFWLSEEKMTFSGWDFSHIADRISGEELPWDYKAVVLSSISSDKRMLDMGTGGGEFLLSLNPRRGRTYATEAYPPNFELSKRVLSDHGIEVRQLFRDEELPFEDQFFDLIINRHESFAADEVFRVLKPGGRFITQQVGGRNNIELSDFLTGAGSKETDAGFDLKSTANGLIKSGFTIMDGQEFFPACRFYDVGALVYFAKIIEWEFSGFSVERCFDQLCQLHERVERDGYVQTTEHRFFITAKK